MGANAFMTPEELKDLETPIDPDDDERELEALAAGDDEPKDEPNDEPKGEARPDGDGKSDDEPKDPPRDEPAAEAGDEAGKPADPPADEPKDEPRDEPAAPAAASAPYVEAPIPVVVPPVEDYEGKVKALDAKLAEAHEQFSAGELDDAGLRAVERQVDREIAKLDVQQQMHETTTAAAKQADVTAWDRAFSRFTGATKDVDYTKQDAFNALVRAVAFERTEAQAAGEDLTRVQLLERAHKTLLVRMGKAPAAAATPEKPKPRENPPGPKTLAHLPAAIDTAASNAKGDQFAAMDEMDEEARQLAFEKLSPADQKRYLGAE